MKTVSGKVVIGRSLSYLSNSRAQLDDVGCPLLPEIFDQSDPPPYKTAISSLLFARSSTSITATEKKFSYILTEKVQLSLIGRGLEDANWPFFV